MSEIPVCMPADGISPPPIVPFLPPMLPCMAARQELTEEDEIEQVDTMVNETGGDDDPVDAIDEEDDVSVCVGTQMSINWFKRKGMKSNPGPSDDNYLIQIDGELEKLGKEDFCRNSKNCECLHILGDAHVRTPVAKFLLNFYKKPKIDRDNIVMTWFRYASRGGKERKHVYYLPFDNNDRSGDALDINKYSSLVESTICTSAMMDLIQVKKGYMESIRASLRKIGVAKKNGNTGKRKGFKETDEVLIHLRLYFEELSKLGETRATRTVEDIVDGEVVVGNRANDDDDIYLPMSMGYRPCYSRYMDGLGYKVITRDSGAYEVVAKDPDNESVIPYVSLVAFYKRWKMEYPHLKVSRVVEDICALCYMFANRHKYFANHTTNNPDGTVNSTVDESLFRGEEGGVESETNTQGFDPHADDDALEPEVASQSTPQPPSPNTIPTTTEESKTEVDSEAEEADDEEPVLPEIGDMSTEDPETSVHAEAFNPADESREKMLLRAAKHVKMARVQRIMYQFYVAKAINHARTNIQHSQRTYTFVVDYGQNMELPLYNSEQPGCSYYYSPLSIYNLGVVNHAHEYDKNINRTKDFKAHLHAHVYHEGIAKKGSNNVVSLIMKTLKDSGLLRAGDPGGELVIVFDNCSGQNKNNTVLKMVTFLCEMLYFKKVQFLFLVVGHTKNAADRLFNMLKRFYRLQNLFTMQQLMKALSASDSVTIHSAQAEDFFDYDKFLSLYYSDLKGKIKQNHIFRCNIDANRVGNQIQIELRESNLAEHKVVRHNSIKCGFFGRDNYPKGAKGLKLAVKNRHADITAAQVTQLAAVEPPGINIYKRVEMRYKYRPIIPQDDKGDALYEDVPEEVREAVKEEKSKRQVFKKELNEKKKKAMKREMEKAAELDDKDMMLV